MSKIITVLGISAIAGFSVMMISHSCDFERLSVPICALAAIAGLAFGRIAKEITD